MDGENFMENPMNKWMIWGYHYFWKHPDDDWDVQSPPEHSV